MGHYKILIIFTKIGHSIISILPEISCKGLTVDDMPELMERTQKIMQEEYTRITKEAITINNYKNRD